MKGWLEKSSGIGAVVAAAACPGCFPKLALIGALFGLGALSAYESQLFIAAQALVAIALVGHAFAYRRHRNPWLLCAAAASAAAVFAGLYLFGSEPVVYIGFAGLIATSATQFWNRLNRRRGAHGTESQAVPPP
jgi:mercuric ion transport protein